MQRIRITRSRNPKTYTLVTCPTCKKRVRQFSDGRLSKHYLIDNDRCPGRQLHKMAARRQIQAELAERKADS